MVTASAIAASILEDYALEKISSTGRVHLAGEIISDGGSFPCLKLWQPEGYSDGRFRAEVLEIPSATCLDRSAKIEWQTAEPCPEAGSFGICWNLQVLDKEGVFCCDQWSCFIHQPNLIAPQGSCKEPPFHVLELYAGGIGGWSAAWTFLQDHAHIGHETIAVEQDLSACIAFAMNHNAAVMNGLGKLHCDDLTMLPKPVILQAHIEQSGWWSAVAKWGVDIMSISASCKPWSGAAAQPGLFAFEGESFAVATQLTKIFRPALVFLEQVYGFNQHPHKPIIVALLKMAGYIIRWEKIVDAADQSAVHRFRWLAIAVRFHDMTIVRKPFVPWKKIQCTPTSIDAIVQWDPAQLNSLKISEEAFQKACQWQFLPPAKRCFARQFSEAKVIATRCNQGNETVDTFMALYTSQHGLSDQVLRTKGYMAHFVQVPTPEEKIEGKAGTPRWWHPFEACMLHICYKRCFIVNDRAQAWIHVGNQISVPHALLVIVNGLNLVLSGPAELDLHALFGLLHKSHMQANRVLSVAFDEGTLFRDRRFDGIELDNIDVRPLLRYLSTGTLPGDLVWHPCLGLQAKQVQRPAAVGIPHAECNSAPLPCEVRRLGDESGHAIESASKRPRTAQTTSPAAPTDVDSSDSEDGDPFFDHVLFQQGSVVRGLWSDNRIQQEQFVNIWHHQIISLGHEEPPMPGREILKFGSCSIHSAAPSHLQPLCLMLGGQLTLLAHPDSDTVIASLVRSTGSPVWDQFGKVGVGAIWESHIAFFDHQVSPGTLNKPVGVLLPAFRAWPSHFHWCPTDDQLQLTIAGHSEQVQDIEAFWHGAIRDLLASIGRQWSLIKSHSQVTIVLGPVSTKVALPPDHSWLAIGVSAFRVLLDGCTVEPSCAPCVLVQWNSHHLWKGHLDPACQVRDLEDCLCYVLRPVIGPSNIQFVIRGHTLSSSDTIGAAMQMHAAPHIVHLRCDWTCHGNSAPLVQDTAEAAPDQTTERQAPTVSCTATWPAATSNAHAEGDSAGDHCPLSEHSPNPQVGGVEPVGALTHDRLQGTFPFCVIPAKHTQLPDIFPLPLFLSGQCQIGHLIAKIRSVMQQQGVRYSGPVYIVFEGRVLKHATRIADIVTTPVDRHFPRTLTITAEDLFGVAFKHTHKTKVSNALAGTLLEGGFAIQWVSKTMELLGTKVDHKDLTAVAGIPAGPKHLSAILELCHSRQIDVPAQGTKDHHPNQSSKQTKQRRLQAQPDPTQYRIAAGYFLNEDNTECEQIVTFKSGATGVYLCSSQEAVQWLSTAGRLSVMNWHCWCLANFPLESRSTLC